MDTQRTDRNSDIFSNDNRPIAERIQKQLLQYHAKRFLYWITGQTL